MSKDKALLNCTFSWGKICRLYEDSLEVAGKFYDLDDLTAIHPTYRRLFGVPSARLDLSFGPRRITLRGIADPEIARQMVSHLLTYCPEWSTSEGPRARPIKGRDLVRAQARAWERTNKLPAMPKSSQESVFDAETETRLPAPESAPVVSEAALSEPSLFEADEETFEETASETSKQKQVEEIYETSEQETTALVVCEPSSPASVLRSQPLHVPRLQPPLRSVQLVNAAYKRLASSSMPAVSAIKSSVLPVIHVPVRLQPGECAHYSIGATLCSERVSGSDTVMYPPLDNGLLILTNRRIFYIGKRSQLILPYTQLWYVSLLQDAIALHVERQFRRIIIEVEHSPDWASRIEQLAFIARRAPVQSARLPLSSSALVTLEASSEIECIITRRERRVHLPGYFRPALREARIVEARTVSLEEQDRSTREFSPEDAKTIALHEQGNTGTEKVKLLAIQAPAAQELHNVHPVVFEALTTQEFAAAPIEAQVTQEFSQVRSAAVEALPTQTFEEIKSPRVEEKVTGADSDLLADQEFSSKGRECEEIETRPLYGQENKDDEDERTICLRDRPKKVPAPGIPRRVQTRRKLTSLADSDDPQVGSRRVLRGRTKRLLQP